MCIYTGVMGALMNSIDPDQVRKALATFYKIQKQIERRLHSIEVSLIFLCVLALVMHFDRVLDRFGLIAAVISSAVLIGGIGWIYSLGKSHEWNE